MGVYDLQHFGGGGSKTRETEDKGSLTGDATFRGGRGATPLLGPGKVLASDRERGVSRLTLLVAAGRGAAGRGGRLVAAVGRVAVARLWARAGAGGADVGDDAPCWATAEGN